VNWRTFSDACPELASIARDRLEERHLCLVGTLRRDGWPRITPVEPYVVGDELMLGMMWRSRKAADLLRDPRITDWAATEGDVKLYGHAEDVRDTSRRVALYEAIDAAHGWTREPDEPEDDPEYHVFAVDILRAGYTRFHEETWESWSWDPDADPPLRRREQPK
jgi:hypothetical protein